MRLRATGLFNRQAGAKTYSFIFQPSNGQACPTSVRDRLSNMKKFRIGAKHLLRISRFSADRASASQPPPLQSVCWSLHSAMCHRAIGIRTARHTFQCGLRKDLERLINWWASIVGKLIDSILSADQLLFPRSRARSRWRRA